MSGANQNPYLVILFRCYSNPGYETSLWTANRVAHLIEQESGVSYHPGHVWKILSAARLELPAPGGSGTGAR